MTEERFALTGGRSYKTGAKQDPMCASIGRIGAKELRGRNSALTVANSELIYAKCAATGRSCDRIVAIYAATVVIFAETGAMRAGDKGVRGKRGERGRESEFRNMPLVRFPRSPFPLLPFHFVIPSSLMKGLMQVTCIPSITSRRQARAGLSFC